jgi:hypothetical protein
VFRRGRKIGLRFLVVGQLMMLLGCSGGSGRSAAEPGADSLPAYDEQSAALFNDSIAPDTVDKSFADTRSFARERLRARAARADAIWPIRVATISEIGRSFDLILDPAGPPLAGPALGGPLTLNVASSAPAHGFLTTVRHQLVGQNLLVLYKRFQEEGEVKAHFRLEADTEPTRRTISDARALNELGYGL